MSTLGQTSDPSYSGEECDVFKIKDDDIIIMKMPIFNVVNWPVSEADPGGGRGGQDPPFHPSKKNLKCKEKEKKRKKRKGKKEEEGKMRNNE